MTRANYLALLGGMCSILPSIQDAFAQACADASGTWLDADAWLWTLGQDPNGTITGLHGQAAGGTCTQGQQYVITSGSYTGDGNFNVTATQTGVAAGGGSVAGCPVHKNISGTIEKPGCDHAQVHWGNDGVTGGNQLWTQSCLIPPTETTTFEDWDLVDSEPTEALFNATLASPLQKPFNYGGRTVTETFPQGGTDTCYFAAQGKYLPWTPVAAPPHVISGNGHNVYGDRIGAPGDVVEFYRSHNRAPCSFKTAQKITVDCRNGPQVYITNPLEIDIADATVTVTRVAGDPHQKVWGTSQSEFRAAQVAIIRLLFLRRHVTP
jgi:hypothetical protein